jgi:hypothetical protein
MRMVFTSVDDVVKQNPRSAILSRRPKSTPRTGPWNYLYLTISTPRRTTAALDSDTELAEAFGAGTRPPTAIICMWAVPNNQPRASAKARDRILMGKGCNER